MQKYLNPAPQKLAAKGVASVKSRVCNLRDFAPDLDISDIPAMLVESFEEVYGGVSAPLEIDAEASQKVSDYAKEFSTDEWLYRGEQVLDFSKQEKFDWGLARLDWSEEAGKFKNVSFFTDGLEPDLFVDVDHVLLGKEVDKDVVAKALVAEMNAKAGASEVRHAQYANDVASLIEI